jgi:hypothetical protein
VRVPHDERAMDFDRVARILRQLTGAVSHPSRRRLIPAGIAGGLSVLGITATDARRKPDRAMNPQATKKKRKGYPQ